MNKDIRVLVSFRNSTKRKKLLRALGADGVLALIDLWAYTAENRPLGMLSDMTVEDIEIAVDWRGENGALVSALTEIGWLDFDGEIYRVHNWEMRNPWAFGAELRSEQARKAVNSRWEKIRKNNQQNQEVNTGSNTASIRSEEMSNTPSPSPLHLPSLPSPLPNTDTTSSQESTKTVEAEGHSTAPMEDGGVVVLAEVAKLHFQVFGYALKADQAALLKGYQHNLVVAKYREALERNGTSGKVKSFKWIEIGLNQGLAPEKPGFFKRVFGGAAEDRQKGYRVDVG